MVNQTCVWSTYLCNSGPVWQKLAVFWGTQKISQTFGERTFAKFRDKNAEFVNFCDKNAVLVNFCNKNVTFSNTRLFWKYFGSGSGIAKNYRVGSGIGNPSDTVHRVGYNLWKVTPPHLAKGSKFKKYFLRLVLVSWCLSCWVGWRRQTALSCCESVPPTAEQQAGQLPPNCLRCYEKSSLYFVQFVYFVYLYFAADRPPVNSHLSQILWDIIATKNKQKQKENVFHVNVFWEKIFPTNSNSLWQPIVSQRECIWPSFFSQSAFRLKCMWQNIAALYFSEIWVEKYT